jgi:hypothetical protein
MPIPAAPSGPSDVVSTVLALFDQLHDQVRQEIAGLDDLAVNWTPTRGTNSIATIVTHLVGSEAETLRGVAGLPSSRHRPGEFGGERRTAAEVIEELAGSDRLIAELRPRLTSDRLDTLLSLPTLPADQRRSGLTWLAGNYGHAREHVGHIQLTKQLYQAG